MPGTHRKSRWSADVTAHSDALDLEPKVFEKKSADQIAKSLKRSAEVERPAEIESVPVGDVDVDLLHEPSRPKSSCRTKAHSRRGETKIARLVRTQFMKLFRPTVGPAELGVSVRADCEEGPS